MHLRESRFALHDAVNAHDIAGIKTYVDPAYTARGLGGVTIMDYAQILEYASRMFASHPDYRETLEVEGEAVDGDTGKLTTRRTETYKASTGVERTNVARQVETWRRIDGRWLIVEEQAAGSPEAAWPLGALKGFLSSPQRPRRSVGLFVACAVVVIASFLPWASIPLAVNFGEVPMLANVFGGLRLTMTGWNGHLSLPGITLPNWLVVIGAVAVGLLHAMPPGVGWHPHPAVSLLISAYGILHVVALAGMILSNGGTIDIGLMATLASYFAILFLVIKETRTGKRGVVAEV